MASSTSGPLNTNVDKANDVGMALTTESSITLIVKAESGKHDKHTICLELSGDENPETAEFVDILDSMIVGSGVRTVHHNGNYVKAKVCKAEGRDSQVKVWIVAR